MLQVVKHNLENADSVAMYELGCVYLPNAKENLPDEPRKLAGVLCGRRTAAAWDDPQGVAPPQCDFCDLKGVVESLAGDLHLPDVSFAAVQTVPWLHPMRAAEVRANGKALGVFGELHPKVAANFGLSERAVQVAELDLEALLAAVPERYGYKPFSTFPPAKRDIAIVVPEATTTETVLAEIRAGGGDLLTDATLFDVYRGTGLPDGTKSLAFALTYQAPDRTLGDKEITKAHEKVEGPLAARSEARRFAARTSPDHGGNGRDRRGVGEARQDDFEPGGGSRVAFSPQTAPVCCGVLPSHSAPVFGDPLAGLP